MNSCYKCAHCFKDTESWEMPHIWWWVCAARPAMANLKSFPFHQTTCKAWEQSRPFAGLFKLVLNPAMPSDEVHFVEGGKVVVGRIVNLEKPDDL